MDNSNIDKLEEKIDNHFSQPLSTKVVRGGLWVFALRIVNRCLGFIRIIILARLLAPEDFGLFGIAMLAIAALETFSQTGFHSALVQKKENIETHLDTAWTVSIIRGGILFIILFFSAPLVAKFFHSPQASLIVKILAISTLLTGFKNIGITFFQKEMKFNKQFVYEISGTLVDLTVAISLAFMLRNFWALVWGGLAGNCVRLVMSYLLQPYRPRLKFEKDKFLDLFGFGKWVLGSSILVFLITQGDDIFVGKVLGISALGFYQMAYVLSNAATTEISHVLSQVSFPAYSKIQHDLPKLRDAYLKVLQLTSFIAIPLAGGIFILAAEFTEIFLGPKWMPMVPAVQVLALAGLVRSVAATTGAIFHGVGKPKIDTFWQVIRLSILAATIYPLSTNWGILGTSVAVLLSISLSTVGFSYQVIKITRCGKLNFLKMVILPFFNTMIMIFILSLIKIAISTVVISTFFILILIGCISYILITYLFDKLLDYHIHAVIKESIASL